MTFKEISSYSPKERARFEHLLDLLPPAENVLEIGARDGRVTKLLSERYPRVTALDLTMPQFSMPKVQCVAGDVTKLAFESQSFDLVLCTEVLEHVPDLQMGCEELKRVSSRYVLIGVPFNQDTRAGRTTCGACGRTNPPYGHVNQFTERRLLELFDPFVAERVTYLGETRERTNALSAWLMECAKHPFGTYSQEEPCIHCGAKLEARSRHSASEIALTKAAAYLLTVQRMFEKPAPIWIHSLFRRP